MSMPRQQSQAGFTVIELIVVAIVLIVAGFLIFMQMNNIQTAADNSQRKTAINSMYYALEEVYYKQHLSYPQTLAPATLPSVDPALFTDPDGFTLGKPSLSETDIQNAINSGNASHDTQAQLASLASGRQANYHYDATNCDTSGNCKGYTLRADLVGEAEYVKKNRSH